MGGPHWSKPPGTKTTSVAWGLTNRPMDQIVDLMAHLGLTSPIANLHIHDLKDGKAITWISHKFLADTYRF